MKATETEKVNPWIKPGRLGQAPKSDMQRAKSAEDAAELMAAGRLHTFEEEMREQGIEPGDPRHRRSFEWAMMWLMQNRPYYAYVFHGVVRRRTHAIDTLCVTVRNGRIELWYNPDFLAIHNLRHNVGFLQHEAGHLIHGHLEVGRKAGPSFFADPINNIAMDLSVDSSIQDPEDQPDWVLLPSKLRIPVDGVPEDKWQSFPERATWETYRDLLRQMRDQFPQQYQKQVILVVGQRPRSDAQMGDGDGSGGEGREDGDGKGTRDVDGDPMDGNGAGGRQDGTVDDHRAWIMNDSDESDTIEDVVKYALRESYLKDEANGGRMRGYMHGDVVAMIEEKIREKAVPFERILRKFVGSHIKVGRKPCMIRLSRRRKVPPGNTFQRQLLILWARDTSGSMSDEELILAYNELHGLAQSSNVRVMAQDFDHGLQGELIDLNAFSLDKAREVKGRGGTDFEEVTKLANDVRPDVLLIFTDGYAPTPTRPNCPVGWILTSGGQEHPWGMTIRMPTIDEIRTGRKAIVERWQ